MGIISKILSITNTNIVVVTDDNKTTIIQRKFICKDLIYNGYTFVIISELQKFSDRSYHTAVCRQDACMYRIEYFNQGKPIVYEKPDNIVKIDYKKNK